MNEKLRNLHMSMPGYHCVIIKIIENTVAYKINNLVIGISIQKNRYIFKKKSSDIMYRD